MLTIFWYISTVPTCLTLSTPPRHQGLNLTPSTPPKHQGLRPTPSTPPQHQGLGMTQYTPKTSRFKSDSQYTPKTSRFMSDSQYTTTTSRFMSDSQYTPKTSRFMSDSQYTPKNQGLGMTLTTPTKHEGLCLFPSTPPKHQGLCLFPSTPLDSKTPEFCLLKPTLGKDNCDVSFGSMAQSFLVELSWWVSRAYVNMYVLGYKWLIPWSSLHCLMLKENMIFNVVSVLHVDIRCWPVCYMLMLMLHMIQNSF